MVLNRGYEAPKFLGIHALKILKVCCRLLWVQWTSSEAKPWITVFSEFFVTKFKLNTMFFFTTRKCRCCPVFECLFVFDFLLKHFTICFGCIALVDTCCWHVCGYVQVPIIAKLLQQSTAGTFLKISQQTQNLQLSYLKLLFWTCAWC